MKVTELRAVTLWTSHSCLHLDSIISKIFQQHTNLAYQREYSWVNDYDSLISQELYTMWQLIVIAVIFNYE